MARKGQPLPDSPGSNITYSVHYEEMKAAWNYHLSPGEYYEKPRWERAVMVAFTRLYNGIEYWMFEDSKPPESGVKASRTAMKKPKKKNLRRR